MVNLFEHVFGSHPLHFHRQAKSLALQNMRFVETPSWDGLLLNQPFELLVPLDSLDIAPQGEPLFPGSIGQLSDHRVGSRIASAYQVPGKVADSLQATSCGWTESVSHHRATITLGFAGES